MVFRLPANKDNIGNPTLPAIHGGVIAGFMEHAAMLHLLTFMSIPHLPRSSISPSITCVPGTSDTYAQCQVWRQGRRVAERRDQRLADQGEPIATRAGISRWVAVSRTLRKVG